MPIRRSVCAPIYKSEQISQQIEFETTNDERVRGHLIFFVGIASPSHTKQNKPNQLGTATAIIQRIENVDKRYTKNRWSGMHIMNTFCNNFAAAVGCVCVCLTDWAEAAVYIVTASDRVEVGGASLRCFNVFRHCVQIKRRFLFAAAVGHPCTIVMVFEYPNMCPTMLCVNHAHSMGRTCIFIQQIRSGKCSCAQWRAQTHLSPGAGSCQSYTTYRYCHRLVCARVRVPMLVRYW